MEVSGNDYHTQEVNVGFGTRWLPSNMRGSAVFGNTGNPAKSYLKMETDAVLKEMTVMFWMRSESEFATKQRLLVRTILVK